VGAGRIGPDLHVFHNLPYSERVGKSGSATRMVNGQSTGPRVARIGGGFYGFGYSICFLKKKKKLIIIKQNADFLQSYTKENEKKKITITIKIQIGK